MKSSIRFSTIALLLASTLLLNACAGSSKAGTSSKKSSSTASASVKDDNDCSALDHASFEVEAALMGLGMSVEMGSSMVDSNLERTETAIAKVKALKLKDAKVKALHAKYLSLVNAALQPVIAKKGNEAALKAVAADVKAKISAADEFRKEQIFFGDCKK